MVFNISSAISFCTQRSAMPVYQRLQHNILFNAFRYLSKRQAYTKGSRTNLTNTSWFSTFSVSTKSWLRWHSLQYHVKCHTTVTGRIGMVVTKVNKKIIIRMRLSSFELLFLVLKLICGLGLLNDFTLFRSRCLKALYKQT